MNGKSNHIPTVAHVAEAKFETKVLHSKLPVLVAFWVASSQRCRSLNAKLEELAHTLRGEARVFKVDADECVELSSRYKIQSIPTLLCFVDGKPRFRIVSPTTRHAIVTKLRNSDSRLFHRTKPLGCKNAVPIFP